MFTTTGFRGWSREENKPLLRVMQKLRGWVIYIVVLCPEQKSNFVAGFYCYAHSTLIDQHVLPTTISLYMLV